MSRHGNTQPCDRATDEELYRRAVHSQTQDYGEGIGVQLGVSGQLHTATLKKQVLIPKEETVKVPVVRKEASRRKEKRIVVGQKLVPVTKYKEVQEQHLQVREVMENGRMEKRHVPVTRTRKIPFTEYEVREVEIEVEVPWEEVITRHGYRHDTHVVSQVFDVEEDHVYEMRPVLVKKGDMRMQPLDDHHKFKKIHGKPVWEGSTQEGFPGVPRTPLHRPDLHRPDTAGSVPAGAPSGNTFTYSSPAYSPGKGGRAGSSSNLQSSGAAAMQRQNSGAKPRKNH